jgi:hypothetical protein
MMKDHKVEDKGDASQPNGKEDLMANLLDTKPRTLSMAVKHLLEALDCFHTDLSFHPNDEEAEELKTLAEQLQAMICTTVNHLRPVPPMGSAGGPRGGGPTLVFPTRT